VVGICEFIHDFAYIFERSTLRTPRLQSWSESFHVTAFFRFLF